MHLAMHGLLLHSLAKPCMVMTCMHYKIYFYTVFNGIVLTMYEIIYLSCSSEVVSCYETLTMSRESVKLSMSSEDQTQQCVLE